LLFIAVFVPFIWLAGSVLYARRDGDLEPFEEAHPEEHGVAQTVVRYKGDLDVVRRNVSHTNGLQDPELGLYPVASCLRDPVYEIFRPKPLAVPRGRAVLRARVSRGRAGR
jgi:hypothetical protein